MLTARAAFAADPAAEPPAPATDPSYRLAVGDRITVSIFGEAELTTQQIVDRDGQVRLPMIGALAVGGHTIREMEHMIELQYRGQEFLRDPQATVSVSTYAPREVSVLGAVRSPGTFQFPTDSQSLDIRDVIARQGGFTPVAKGDSVAVTRRQADNREITTIVDVDRMMYGRSRNRENVTVFLIYPGDRIFIPERLF